MDNGYHLIALTNYYQVIQNAFMDVYDDWQDLDKPQKNLSTDVTKRGIVQQLRGGDAI